MTLVQPRRRLNPAFVDAVLASRVPRYRLARRSGFTQSQHFSSLLHAVVVVASCRTVARLRVVAQLIGFTGDILLDEVLAPVVVKREVFDRDHLSAPTRESVR